MNKTVFITGCSTGIGRATVDKFLVEGWNVVATSRHIDAKLFDKNENIYVQKLDVTNPLEVNEAYIGAVKRFGKVDVLVNNAGYGFISPFEYMTSDEINKQFAVNVLGLFDVTKKFIPHFRANNEGVVINVSSMYGKISMPYFSMYSATKHAIEGFSESLQQEVEEFGIKIKVIEPGIIKSKFFKNIVSSNIPNGSIYNDRFKTFINSIQHRSETGASAELAATCIYKAAISSSPKLRYIPDKTARLLINLHRFLPFNVYTKAIRKNVG